MLAKLKSPIGCGVFAALFFGIWLLAVLALSRREDPYLAQVDLPGGKHRLRLLQTSDGPLDYAWKPSRFANWLPQPGGYVPPIEVHLDGFDSMSRQPGHSFLFRVVNESGRYTNPNQTMIGFEFAESTGFVFKRFGFADFPHWGVYALTRSDLPRRDKELTVRIKPDMNAAAFVEMKFPNPAYQEQIAEWSPEPLPATQTQGVLTAQLRGMKYHPNEHGHGYYSYDVRGESETLEWKNCYFSATLEDATGNRGNSLSPFEPAWKVKALAYRNQAAEFPPELVSSTIKVPILGLGQFQPFEKVVEVAGQRIRIRGAGGAGIVSESQGLFTAQDLEPRKEGEPPLQHAQWSIKSVNGQQHFTVKSPVPFAWIEPDFIPEQEQIVIRQQKEGVLVPCQSNYVQSSDRHAIVAELDATSGASEVEIQIAVNRPIPFEFVVAPPESAKAYWREQSKKTSPIQ